MTPAQRLARVVATRMQQLGMNQAELVRLSNVSPPTIKKMIHAEGDTYQPSSKRQIAQALGWTPDSIDRVLRGDDPLLAGTELPAGTAASGIDLSDLSSEDRARVLGYIDALRARRHHN